MKVQVGLPCLQGHMMCHFHREISKPGRGPKMIQVITLGLDSENVMKETCWKKYFCTQIKVLFSSPLKKWKQGWTLLFICMCLFVNGDRETLQPDTTQRKLICFSHFVFFKEEFRALPWAFPFREDISQRTDSCLRPCVCTWKAKRMGYYRLCFLS